MTDWIETMDGWVNAAHVAAVEEGGERGAFLKGANGDTLGRVCSGVVPETIVPAAPGTILLLLWKPVVLRGGILTQRQPIIAWAMPADGRSPVAITIDGRHRIANDAASGFFYVVQTADGALLVVGDYTSAISSLEDAENLAHDLWAERGRRAVA
jgi:hypothetical protein